MPTLLLVRANKSGGSVRWSDDDYDVREGERVIGRIMLRAEGPFSFAYQLGLSPSARLTGSVAKAAIRPQAAPAPRQQCVESGALRLIPVLAK